jgi:hypothetical protein
LRVITADTGSRVQPEGMERRRAETGSHRGGGDRAGQQTVGIRRRFRSLRAPPTVKERRMMSKDYERPAMLVTKIQLGVFGQYGMPDRNEIPDLQILDRHSSR